MDRQFSSTHVSYSHLPLDALISVCQHERRSYSTAQIDNAPACVELIRRSLAGDQDAWGAFQQLFAPLMRAWIGVQQQVEPDDVLQEALLAFARWAPSHPDLTIGVELGRALAFLRQCTKTALLSQLRKLKQPLHLSLDSIAFAAPHDPMAETEVRLLLHGRVAQLLTSDDEQLVFRELLVNGRTPQELFRLHNNQFASMAALRVVIQRVLRRLRRDEELQMLW